MNKTIINGTKRVVSCLIASSMIFTSLVIPVAAQDISLTADSVEDVHFTSENYYINREEYTISAYNNESLTSSRITGDILINTGGWDAYTTGFENLNDLQSINVNSTKHIEGYIDADFAIKKIYVYSGTSYHEMFFLSTEGYLYNYTSEGFKKVENNSDNEIKFVDINGYFGLTDANELKIIIGNKVVDIANDVKDFIVYKNDISLDILKGYGPDSFGVSYSYDYFVQVKDVNDNIKYYYNADSNTDATEVENEIIKANQITPNKVVYTYNGIDSNLDIILAYTQDYTTEYISDGSSPNHFEFTKDNVNGVYDVDGFSTTLTLTSTDEISVDENGQTVTANGKIFFELVPINKSFLAEAVLTNAIDCSVHYTGYTGHSTLSKYTATVSGKKMVYEVNIPDGIYTFAIRNNGDITLDSKPTTFYSINFNNQTVEKKSTGKAFVNELIDVVNEDENNYTFEFSYNSNNLIVTKSKFSSTATIEIISNNNKDMAANIVGQLSNYETNSEAFKAQTSMRVHSIATQNSVSFVNTAYIDSVQSPILVNSIADEVIKNIITDEATLFLTNNGKVYKLVTENDVYNFNDITPAGKNIVKINNDLELLTDDGVVYSENGSIVRNNITNIYNGIYKTSENKYFYSNNDKEFLFNYVGPENIHFEREEITSTYLKDKIYFPENTIVKAPNGQYLTSGDEYTFTANGTYVFNVKNNYDEEFNYLILVNNILTGTIDNPIVSALNNTISITSDYDVKYSTDKIEWTTYTDEFEYENPFYVKAISEDKKTSNTLLVTLSNNKLIFSDETKKAIDANNFCGLGYIGIDGCLHNIEGNYLSGDTYVNAYIYKYDENEYDYTYIGINNYGDIKDNYTSHSSYSLNNLYYDDTEITGYSNPIKVFFDGIYNYIFGEHGDVIRLDISNEGDLGTCGSGRLNEWNAEWLGQTADISGNTINFLNSDNAIDLLYNPLIDKSLANIKYASLSTNSNTKTFESANQTFTFTLTEPSLVSFSYGISDNCSNVIPAEVSDTIAALGCNGIVTIYDSNGKEIGQDYRDSSSYISALNDNVSNWFEGSISLEAGTYTIKLQASFEKYNYGTLINSYLYDYSESDVDAYMYIENFKTTPYKINKDVTILASSLCEDGFVSMDAEGNIYLYNQLANLMLPTEYSYMAESYKIDYSIDNTIWSNTKVNVNITPNDDSAYMRDEEITPDEYLILQEEDDKEYVTINPSNNSALTYSFAIPADEDLVIEAIARHHRSWGDIYGSLIDVRVNNSYTLNTDNNEFEDIESGEFKTSMSGDTWYKMTYTIRAGSSGSYKVNVSSVTGGVDLAYLKIGNEVIDFKSDIEEYNSALPSPYLIEDKDGNIYPSFLTEEGRTISLSNGIYKISCYDDVDNIVYSTGFEIKNVDTVNPTIKATFNNNSYTLTANDVAGTGLNSNSAISGIEGTYISVNDVDFVKCTKPIKYDSTVSEIKETSTNVLIPEKVFTAYALDNAGNKSVIECYEFDFLLNYEIVYENGSTTIIFYGDSDSDHTDTDYTYSYKIENNDSNDGYTASVNENSTITIIAKKDTETGIKTLDADVDLTVIKTDKPNISDIRNHNNVDVTAGEIINANLDKLYIKVDDEEYISYTEGQTLTLTEGKHTIAAYQIVKASIDGETITITSDEVSKEFKVISDSLKIHENITYEKGKTIITFYADDDIDNLDTAYEYYYKINNGVSSPGHKVEITLDSTVTIYASHPDKLSNDKELDVKVYDTKEPVITPNTQAEKVKITSGAITNATYKNMYISIDNGKYELVTTSTKEYELSPGEHTVKAYQIVTGEGIDFESGISVCSFTINDIPENNDTPDDVLEDTPDDVLEDTPDDVLEDTPDDILDNNPPANNNTPKTSDNTPILPIMFAFTISGLTSVIFINTLKRKKIENK